MRPGKDRIKERKRTVFLCNYFIDCRPQKKCPRHQINSKLDRVATMGGGGGVAARALLSDGEEIPSLVGVP